MEGLTPTPKRESKAMTMSFYDALRRMREGKKVSRISWGNNDYGFFDNEWLSIYTKNKVHVWQVSEADVDGQDWIIVTELN